MPDPRSNNLTVSPLEVAASGAAFTPHFGSSRLRGDWLRPCEPHGLRSRRDPRPSSHCPERRTVDDATCLLAVIQSQLAVLFSSLILNFIPVRAQPETVARDLENSDPPISRGIAVLFFCPKRWRS
jgi:hypothetical protein